MACRLCQGKRWWLSTGVGGEGKDDRGACAPPSNSVSRVSSRSMDAPVAAAPRNFCRWRLRCLAIQFCDVHSAFHLWSNSSPSRCVSERTSFVRWRALLAQNSIFSVQMRRIITKNNDKDCRASLLVEEVMTDARQTRCKR